MSLCSLYLPPSLVIALLAGWSMAETTAIEGSLQPAGFFQIIELLCSPLVGAIAGIALARTLELDNWLHIGIGITSALLAVVIQLLQVGWFYRPKRPPLWVFFVVDGLCIFLAYLGL